MKIPTHIKVLVFLFVMLIMLAIGKNIFKATTDFYNKAVTYQLEYDLLTQKQVTVFDNNYLAFREKSDIADVNKETFIKVTEIIMSARKDGQNVAWKWVQENQNIPYNEFTSFYKDISSFTQNRYKENSNIEMQKQIIAKEHNLLIITYPGMVYNYFLKLKPLYYDEGFISSDTKQLFDN